MRVCGVFEARWRKEDWIFGGAVLFLGGIVRCGRVMEFGEEKMFGG